MDNQDFRDQLLNLASGEAIGGEMVAGVESGRAAHRGSLAGGWTESWSVLLRALKCWDNVDVWSEAVTSECMQ
ncbi:MAG: hypothetical protein NVSMB44_40510 [Ktedonobacteraceae bacterium]